MTSVLVTGASGFIGGAVTGALLDAGYAVSVLAREESGVSELRDRGARVFRGDLADRESISKAVAGVEGIFHVAGSYSYWNRDPREPYKTNVNGTENVLKAAMDHGVRRFVYTSTVGTLGWPGKGRLADESCVATIDELTGHYKKSKLAAEQMALAHNSSELEVVVVNPTAPVGPGDARPTPTGRLVLEFLRRRFPGYVDTGVNICDIADVAAGHVAVFERGRPGERYILGGENLSLRDIYALLTESTGLKRTPIRLPYALAYMVGALDSLIEGQLLRRKPYVPLEGLRVARHPMYVDCSRAVTELGLPQRPAIESLDRAARWYVNSGYAAPGTLADYPPNHAEASTT